MTVDAAAPDPGARPVDPAVTAAALGEALHPPSQPPQPALFRRLLALLNGAATVLIFALVVLINSDVVGRSFLSAPLRGTPELVAMSLVAIVFLALPNTLAGGHLIRSEALIEQLERRRPVLGQLVHAGFEACGVLLFGALAWAMVGQVTESVDIGAFVGAQGDFTAPKWPVEAIVMTGAGLTAVAYGYLVVGRLRRVLGHDPMPRPVEA